MTTSNIGRVAELNTIAGNPTDPNWTVAGRQMKIIELEFIELKRAIEAHDFEKVRDGIADLRVTTEGLGHRLGIPIEEDFAEVVDALYTRFDQTFQDAVLTQDKYRNRGVATLIHEHQGADGVTQYVNKVLQDCTGTDGEFYPAGKWLKSHKFREPVFSALPDNPLYQEQLAGVQQVETILHHPV